MSGKSISTHESMIHELLQEYRSNRDALKELLASIEKIKDEVANIFPENIDKRYRYLFEEKVKTATAFFNNLRTICKSVA